MFVLGATMLATSCHKAPATTPPEPTDVAKAQPEPPTAATPKGPPDAEILARSGLPQTLASPLPNDPMAVTIHRLRNGITVYISIDRQAPRVVSWIGVRAGSRMDPANSTGLAHYLEHMLFKGTDDFGTLDPTAEAPHVEAIRKLYADLRGIDDPERRKATFSAIDRETQAIAEFAVPNELDRLYAKMGIEGVNAFTSFEQTVYIGDVPTNRLAAWAAVEGERFSDPVFRLFYPELEAVYEEKNLSLDNPASRMHEATYRAVYAKHPYGLQTTIGSVEHLKTPAYDDMMAFYDRWYVPNNMAIVLAGDVDPATVLPILEQRFGGLQPKELTEPHPGAIDALPTRTSTDVYGDGEEAVRLAWLTVPEGHPDEPVLTVMDRLLDDDSVGLLNAELEMTQKVPGIASWNDNLVEGGMFAIEATARTGQNLDEIEGMVLGVLGKLKQGAFADEDVAAVKLQVAIGRKLSLENNRARAQRMMEAFVSRREWSDVIARDERIDGVTRDDVVRVATAYLGDAFAVVHKRRGQPEIPKLDKPTITPVAIDPSRSSTFARLIEAMPVTPLEPEWAREGEHYQHRTLAAGPMIATVNRRNDLFTLVYRFDRGYRKEPLLCYALELWAHSGAGPKSAQAVQLELYRLGSSVDAFCDAERSGIVITGIDQHLTATLALVDAWRSDPTFDAEAVDKLYANTLSSRQSVMEQDQTLTMALDTYARHGEHSAWLQHPDNVALRKAKPKTLRKLIASLTDYQHRTLYFGPRSADEAMTHVARTAKRFLPTGEIWTREFRSVAEPTVYFLHKDGAKANVRFVMPRAPVARDERPVAELLTEYLGGGMSALVFQEIREARGLAYSAVSVFSPGTRPQDASGLLGFLSTQADKTPEALDTLIGLVRRPSIEDERIQDAKAAIEQAYRASRIDPRQLNAWVLDWDERGEPADPRPRAREMIEGLDAKAVAAFVQTFVGSPPIVAIVGDRTRIDVQALAQIGRVVEVEATQLFSYGKFPEPTRTSG